MTAAIPSGSVRPQGFMAPRFFQGYVKPQGEERAEMKHRNEKPAVPPGTSTGLGKAGANSDEPATITVAWRQ